MMEGSVMMNLGFWDREHLVEEYVAQLNRVHGVSSHVTDRAPFDQVGEQWLTICHSKPTAQHGDLPGLAKAQVLFPPNDI